MAKPSHASAFSFSSSVALLATMHQKEVAIAPLFKQHLDMTVEVAQGFDSDRFGTFSRDVSRTGTQKDAARYKANAVLEATGHTVAIASEGAFYPHPMLPFAACDREIVMLIDRAQELELVGQVISTDTNFAHATVRSVAEAIAFAETAGFPRHALMVMPMADGAPSEQIVKGIQTLPALEDAVDCTLTQSATGTAHVETDMRALYNPTRMGVIAAATQALIETVQHTCPQCGWPGFSIVERRPGLPCGLCGLPTDLTHIVISRCQKCGHTQEKQCPDGVKVADPGQCWNCNP